MKLKYLLKNGIVYRIQCLFCYPQYLARKGEGRELDIELNKLGSRSLFASPGSYSFSHALPYSKGTTAVCSAKGINTPPSPPLQYKIVWGYVGRCWTKEACQSKWNEPIQSL